MIIPNLANKFSSRKRARLESYALLGQSEHDHRGGTGPSTTKEVGTGTGLGLSLVHGIVAELDGAIDVASMPGEGSEFRVYLRRSGDSAESFDNEELATPRGDGQRVLIVGDKEPLARLATRALEELGYVPAAFTLARRRRRLSVPTPNAMTP